MPRMYTYPTWLAIVDAAYNRWEKGDLRGQSYRDFIEALSPLDKKAVLLRNLDYIVGRDGFYGWIHNGFSIYVREVMEILGEIGTDSAKKTRALLKKLSPLINTDKEDIGCTGPLHMLNVDSWNEPAVRRLLVDIDPNYGDAPDEDLGWGVQDYCFERDPIFFQIKDQLASDIETWLQQQAG